MLFKFIFHFFIFFMIRHWVFFFIYIRPYCRKLFVNQQPFVTSNIIGATNLNQLKENIDSIETELSHDTLKEIEKVHELIPDPAT